MRRGYLCKIGKREHGSASSELFTTRRRGRSAEQTPSSRILAGPLNSRSSIRSCRSGDRVTDQIGRELDAARLVVGLWFRR